MQFTRQDLVEVIARFLITFAAALFCLADATAQVQADNEEFPLHIDGDIGMGAYYTHSIIVDKTESVTILPYANFEFGRIFARIDTFGIKTFKMGYGYLELSMQVELDGFKPNTVSLRGLSERKNSLPLGFGTFQEMPFGAFYVSALHDVKESCGNLFDVTYVGRLTVQRLTIYPQIGAEYLSKQYIGYYYGVSTQEANTSQFPRYQPGSALNPFIAGLFETKITQDWNLYFLIRHTWLASSISNSPIVSHKAMDNVFLSLAYSFK